MTNTDLKTRRGGSKQQGKLANKPMLRFPHFLKLALFIWKVHFDVMRMREEGREPSAQQSTSARVLPGDPPLVSP